MSEDLLDIWVRLGMNNPWIKQVGSGDPNDTCAFEKPWGKDYFTECKTVDELMQRFTHGNWMLGVAFYYKNLCFINQINAGDEWLTIKNNIAFESISADLIIEQDGEQRFKDMIEDMLNATPEQLRNLTYDRKHN